MRRHAVAFVALFVALGGGAYAASGGSFVGSDGVITGCVKKGGGQLQVLKAGKPCPRGTTALRFNQQGQTGPIGQTGPPGQDGKTGPAGQPSSGDTQAVQPPAWALGTYSSQVGTLLKPGWDEFYSVNSGVNETLQTLPLTLSEISGAVTRLKSFKFCYGISATAPGTDTINNVSVDAITQPDTITAAAGATPPGGQTTTQLINQSVNFGSQGCPSFTPTVVHALDPSMYLVAHLGWATTSTSYEYLYLGHATFTFGP
jgi:hypothetical protein